MANTLYVSFPKNYLDFGRDALTNQGVEKFNELICEKLPNYVSWVGDNIIGPINRKNEFLDNFDLTEIISEAAEEMCENYGGSDFFEVF